MKDREEYLIQYEAKLLTILDRLYTSLNQNLFLAYGLAGLLIIIGWVSKEAITDFSLLGVKVAIKGEEMVTFMPLFASGIYILIDYQLLTISFIYREINENSSELLMINENAKPITIRNVHLYGTGIAGLILSLARWQANRLLIKSPFRFTFSQILETSIIRTIFKIIKLIRDLIGWTARFLTRALLIVMLFYAPLIFMGSNIYVIYFKNKTITFGMPFLSLIVISLIIISTTICGLILASSYIMDILKSLKKDIDETIGSVTLKKLLKTASRLVDFYVRPYVS